MGILGLISALLTIAAEYFKWQVAESQFRLKTALYQIDQELLAKGKALNDKIDVADTAGALMAVEQLRTDYQNHALYAAGVKLVIPDDAGWHDLGLGAKVSGAAASERGSGNSTEPAPRAKSA